MFFIVFYWTQSILSSVIVNSRFTTDEEIDYAINHVKEAVIKLREMSPLWEMFKEGIDLKTIQWAEH